MHTCDEFKREIREIFLPFQGDFLKMYRIYRKIPDSFQGDFEFLLKKWYVLEEFLQILRLISWSLPDDEGGITCMQMCSAGSFFVFFTNLYKNYFIMKQVHVICVQI